MILLSDIVINKKKLSMPRVYVYKSTFLERVQEVEDGEKPEQEEEGEEQQGHIANFKRLVRVCHEHHQA